MRSVRQRKMTLWMRGNSRKGLILKQEVEGREERGMRIGLQHCEHISIKVCMYRIANVDVAALAH